MKIKALLPILNNTSWYLVEKLLRLTGSFLIGAWVARYLGPAQYGLLAYGLALVSALSFLGSLGIESLIIRDLIQEPQANKRIISTYFVVRLIGACFVPLLIAAYIFLTSPQNVELLVIALISSISVFLSSLDVADLWLQSKHQAKSLSTIRMFSFLSSMVLRCLLVLLGAGPVWFAMVGVVEFALVVPVFYRILKLHNLVPSFKFWDWAELKGMLLEGKVMIFSGLTVAIYSKLDILAVGALLSNDVLGSYAMAASMCAAWNMVGMSLTQAWAPYISLAKAEGDRSYVSMLRKLIVVSLGVSISGSAVLSILSASIFNLLLGPSYFDGIPIFSLLIWSSVPIFLGIATSQIIVNDKTYWISLVRTAIGMVLSLLLIVPAARGWGAMGVASLVVLSSTAATLSILFSSLARTRLHNIFFLR